MQTEVLATQLLKYLAAATYSAYSINLKTIHNGAPERSEWFHTIEPGQLVMEISSIGRVQYDLYRFGFYLGEGLTYTHTDTEWEDAKHNYKDQPRPTFKTKKIKLLTTGEEYHWSNCSFIRVPEEVWTPLTTTLGT